MISATVLLIAFLGTMGLVLENAFRSSALAALNGRLLQQVYGLLSVTEDNDMTVLLPPALTDPLMNQLGSGHFGLVLDDRGTLVWRSQSAMDQGLPSELVAALDEIVATGVPRAGVVSDGSDKLRYLAYRVQWLGERHTGLYDYVVMEQSTLLEAEVEGFRARLWGWLAGIIGLLMALQFVVMRWGLKPLGAFTRDIEAMTEGDQRALSGPYVQELAPLAQTLNRLVDHERQQAARYRTTLANLAHSLKTPLSIIRNALTMAPPMGQPEDHRAEIEVQITQMDELIAYQLERAVIASTHQAKDQLQARVVLDRLNGAMQKVYRDKVVAAEVQGENLALRASERDIQEAWGNLIDNAYKYCAGSIQITVSKNAQGILLRVEDDGPGIADASHEQVLQRGARLDTRAPGQGIGLAVVSEIASRYDGALAISRSKLGGACFDLVLKL
ncbi:MAG: GHKL domain-containing protein [Gammaproteobacteria bacterium]|jgi:two-component system sensor histidine kinase PhoQ|nr:GHKL domain-containing protein [Gammaproteobacteria bacterium]MBT5463842.1 GHKL domain-containing protein [Gammaproteobacteria bacterium]